MPVHSVGNIRYFLDDDNPKLEKTVCFNNAFRNFKNFYLFRLKELLPVVRSPGYSSFSQCAFVHPIQDEATGELAEILDMVSPISHAVVECNPETKSTLQKEYWAHHGYLRAVRKLYYSRLIQHNTAYKEFLYPNATLSLQHQIPLPRELREEIQKQIYNPKPPYLYLQSSESNPAYLKVSEDNYLRSREQTVSLQWMMENPENPPCALWPAKIIDQSYFLERANFKLRGLHLPAEYGNIQTGLIAVANDVGLSEILETHSNKSYIYEPEQQNIQNQIIRNFDALGADETAASLTKLTLETDPMIVSQEHESEQFAASSSSGLAQRSFSGSISISHGIGTAPILNTPFWSSALLLAPYLSFKIYEFFLQKTSKNVNVKSLKYLLDKHKISSVRKEATLPVEQTLRKL